MKPHHSMDIQGRMKVHHFTTGAFWEHDPPSLTLGCKRLRPLAPRAPTTTTTTATDTSGLAISTTSATFSLKSFIRPESCPRKIGSTDYPKKESAQVEAQPGGTRWNPTQEQIGILEMLYRSGMRTPNAQQIEQITAKLAKYGKIEGKNVFYWFQNHKARERQKQKRNVQGHSLSPRLTNTSPLISNDTSLLLSSSSTSKGGAVEEELESNPYKRKCRSWAIFDEQCIEEDNRYCTQEQGEDHEEAQDRTLKLFPLHPEGRF